MVVRAGVFFLSPKKRNIVLRHKKILNEAADGF